VDTPHTEKTLRLSKVFILTCRLCAKLNVYGTGSPRDKDGNDLNITQCLNGMELNPAYLNMLTKAEERVTTYATTYYAPGGLLENAVSRSEKDVSLATLDSLQGTIQESQNRRYSKIIETDVEKLEAKGVKGKMLMSGKECVIELNSIESRLTNLVMHPYDFDSGEMNQITLGELNQLSKRKLAELLSKVRMSRFETNGLLVPPEEGDLVQVTEH
jgi:hypothetical protein